MNHRIPFHQKLKVWKTGEKSENRSFVCESFQLFWWLLTIFLLYFLMMEICLLYYYEKTSLNLLSIFQQKKSNWPQKKTFSIFMFPENCYYLPSFWLTKIQICTRLKSKGFLKKENNLMFVHCLICLKNLNVRSHTIIWAAHNKLPSKIQYVKPNILNINLR